MASDDERKAALSAFDGSAEGRAEIERQVRPTKILRQDSRVIGVAVCCLHALMQIDPADRAAVIQWLRSQSDE